MWKESTSSEFLTSPFTKKKKSQLGKGRILDRININSTTLSLLEKYSLNDHCITAIEALLDSCRSDVMPIKTY